MLSKILGSFLNPAICKPELTIFFACPAASIPVVLTQKIEKIKIFDQHLRGTTSSALQTPDGKLKVILVGDAARDSYYAQGNSVNTAFTALSEHFDDLFANSGPAFATTARRYHARLVDQFVNFIGADIYYRCFCGCTPRTVAPLKSLLFGWIMCDDGQGCTLAKNFVPSLGWWTGWRSKCNTRDPADFKVALRKFCDAAALQNI